jgi:hypothetical protein
MDIHFVSSLTPDDEDRVAAALLAIVTSLLEHFSLAYTVKIETTSSRVLQHTGMGHGADGRSDALAAARFGPNGPRTKNKSKPGAT